MTRIPIDLHAERHLAAEAVPHADPDIGAPRLARWRDSACSRTCCRAWYKYSCRTPRGHAAGRDEDWVRRRQAL